MVLHKQVVIRIACTILLGLSFILPVLLAHKEGFTPYKRDSMVCLSQVVRALYQWDPLLITPFISLIRGTSSLPQLHTYNPTLPYYENEKSSITLVSKPHPHRPRTQVSSSTSSRLLSLSSPGE